MSSNSYFPRVTRRILQFDEQASVEAIERLRTRIDPKSQRLRQLMIESHRKKVLEEEKKKKDNMVLQEMLRKTTEELDELNLENSIERSRELDEEMDEGRAENRAQNRAERSFSGGFGDFKFLFTMVAAVTIFLLFIYGANETWDRYYYRYTPKVAKYYIKVTWKFISSIFDMGLEGVNSFLNRILP